MMNVAPKFGIWGGPNGDQSCFGPGRRQPAGRPAPQVATKTNEEIQEFIGDLTKKAKLVKVTNPGNGRRNSAVEAEFTFGSKNVYTVNLKADGTFTAESSNGVSFKYTHNTAVYGSPKEFSYSNSADSTENFRSMAGDLGQAVFAEKLRNLISAAPAQKGGKKKPTI